MRSGINDFDVPSFNYRALKFMNKDDDPLWEALKFVSKLTGPVGCTDFKCTWVCEPGTCVSYVSTNYILAGLILLKHAPEGQQTWRTYN